MRTRKIEGVGGRELGSFGNTVLGFEGIKTGFLIAPVGFWHTKMGSFGNAHVVASGWRTRQGVCAEEGCGAIGMQPLMENTRHHSKQHSKLLGMCQDKKIFLDIEWKA